MKALLACLGALFCLLAFCLLRLLPGGEGAGSTKLPPKSIAARAIKAIVSRAKKAFKAWARGGNTHDKVSCGEGTHTTRQYVLNLTRT